MKKQLSVFALHARAAIGRLALVLLGILALDAAAYVLFGLRGFRASLTGSELVTALRVIFSLGLVACQLLLASCFGAGSRYGYTLRRLPDPGDAGAALERRVQCALLCVRVVRAADGFGRHGGAARGGRAVAGGRAGHLCGFLPQRIPARLLPLADGYLWVRNVVFVLALGVLTAYMQLGLRRKNGGRAAGTGRADRTDAAGAAGRVRLRPDRGDPAKRGGAVRRGHMRISWIPAGAQRKGGARG